ncbi:PREDICTED: uncharacterized protein LOC109335358 [Lupinus angustifolius]|uniref:uncharacterized protein LOC109335358 n=1 Tax=Lupinus angustifolius TaxID=3871 RepID=UPI00092E8CCC|nr:PREDICTED: uncharacterized protein LOC109335358 [Lupinus angustifolius]
MSISCPFELVRDLNDLKHLWKIVVRITEIWYVQLPPKPGHLEMILMDCKGDKIQVSVKKDEFNQWKDHLIEDNTYVMHNFNVFHNDLQFKACNHAYILQFTTDIIGVVDKMVFSQTQASLKKVIFNLIGSSGDVITCTFLESHAMKFFNCYNNFTIGKYPPTVSNSWCGSKILIDDEIPDYQKYKDSFATLILSCDSLSQGNSQLSQYFNLSNDG